MKPNILFFFGEHHRWDWLGSNNAIPVNTPTLDRLAEDGVRFRQCRCNSPLCAPSRACLASGRRYEHAGVPNNRADLDPTMPTFMKELHRAGYRVAVYGKTDLHKKSHLHGIDGWSERLGQLGFTDAVDMCGKRDSAMTAGEEHTIEPYMAWLHQQGLAEIVLDDLHRRTAQDMDPVATGKGIDTTPFPLERKYQIDDFCGGRALEYIESLPRHAPWFLQLNWGSAHPPFDAAAELIERYSDVSFPIPSDSRDGMTDHQAVRRQYAAMLEGMDEWIGRIIEAVAARGELERTVIVYSADHGEMLGDHGLWNKGRPLEPAVHVPLIVSGANVPRRGDSDALVELIDLAATFVELAGLPVPCDWDSRSLYPLLQGDTDQHRTNTVSALGDWQMAFDGRYKLVEQQGTPSALYDLQSDPCETENIIATATASTNDLVEQLHKAFVC